ncbi:hypothetical protein [Nocardia alni]|uniref:hypothetical protein n=1 Tax=Nocardia alni TaxID=2815723 RepID=UPI001C24E849|nr:hypothetical protein [Nocardia alni]
MTAPVTDTARAEPRPAGWALAGGLLAGLLVFNGLLSFAVEVLYLPTYLGSVPFPISAAFAAVVNILLAMGMGTIVSRPAAMALPVLAWLIGFVICLSPGPGGDVILTNDWTTPLFLACGIVPVGWYLFWRGFMRPARQAARKETRR